MEEIWKDIEGYEGKYQVSNFGKILSLKTNKILKHTKSNAGYAMVRLYHGDTDQKYQFKDYQVHRLVGTHFLPNPNNFPMINHIDENKMNPSAENLEWVSAKQNANHGSRNKTIGNKGGIPVCQYSLDGKLIRIWKSARVVAKVISKKLECDIEVTSRMIREVCKGSRVQAYGYMWRRYDEENIQKQIKHVKYSYNTKGDYKRAMKIINKVKFVENDICEEDLYKPINYTEKSTKELLEEIIENIAVEKNI